MEGSTQIDLAAGEIQHQQLDYETMGGEQEALE